MNPRTRSRIHLNMVAGHGRLGHKPVIQAQSTDKNLTTSEEESKLFRAVGDMLDLEVVDDKGEDGPHKQDRFEKKSRKSLRDIHLSSPLISENREASDNCLLF